MSIYKYTEAFKKLIEQDDTLFKAASDHDISNRPQNPDWTYELLKSKFSEDVSFLEDMGINPDINPDDGHMAGFVVEGGDIYTADDLPHLFEFILAAAKRIEAAVEGPVQ